MKLNDIQRKTLRRIGEFNRNGVAPALELNVLRSAHALERRDLIRWGGVPGGNLREMGWVLTEAGKAALDG